jgi:hypothetical protein
MQVSVIVMPLESGSGYKARVGEPFNVVTEAPGADEAYAALATVIGPKLPAGAELARVDVPVYDRLFDVIGGLDPNSPFWDEWAAAVEEYRRELDATSDPVEAGS